MNHFRFTFTLNNKQVNGGITLDENTGPDEFMNKASLVFKDAYRVLQMDELIEKHNSQIEYPE